MLLIIEEEPDSAQILLSTAHDHNFKVVVATNGEQGVKLAKVFKPSAITLDIHLPIIDGWSVLDRLKHDSQTRHIPVYIVSVLEDERRGLQVGAVSYIQKPSSRQGLDAALEKITDLI